MANEIDVLIGLPSYDGTYQREMYDCYEYMVHHAQSQGLRLSRSKSRGSLLPHMRCAIAETALDREAKFLLCIDADMMFPEDALVRLVNHDLDIISGLAFKKPFPHDAAAARFDRDTEKFIPITTWPEHELIEVDACGAAFLLIKTDVLRALPKPWFYHYNDPNAPMGMQGEDYGFCKSATEAGYKLHIDTELVLKHIGVCYFGIEHWRRAQVIQEKQRLIVPVGSMEN